MSEINVQGQCAFCGNSSHDFPDDAWHEKKHMAGWHACKVLKGFRFSKPGCENFKMSENVWSSVN